MAESPLLASGAWQGQTTPLIVARRGCWRYGSVATLPGAGWQWARQAAAKPAETAPTAAAPADLVSVAALQKAKLIQELGGVAEAKQALAALSQLLD